MSPRPRRVPGVPGRSQNLPGGFSRRVFWVSKRKRTFSGSATAVLVPGRLGPALGVSSAGLEGGGLGLEFRGREGGTGGGVPRSVVELRGSVSDKYDVDNTALSHQNVRLALLRRADGTWPRGDGI